VTLPVVLAVDGGAYKTDLALIRADGALLALARGPQTSPHLLGLDGCLQVLEDLLGEARATADGPIEVAHVMLAGADLPVEEQALQEAIDARGWAARTSVRNDTFAVLRAGTERRWGVAVVCGAGINCVGVAPDGRHARFPSLGAITGDWGGGGDVGLAALSAAVRSEDGRGPTTSLERLVPAHFGMGSPLAVAEAIHLGTLGERRVLELAPLVLAESGEDAVAGELVDRLAAEVVAFARVALTRLELTQADVEVILGGGLMRAGNGRLEAGIEEGLRAVGPRVAARVVVEPPIVGAALLGLDDLGSTAEARTRARGELAAAAGDGLAMTGRTSDG
jgi:N-acetylglucosamine kinase-like BadF-type ATPase